MSKRFTSFIQAMTYMMACLIICYAIKLATQHDPDIRGVELFVMAVVAVTCFTGALWHTITVIYPPKLPANEGWDGD